MRTPRNRITGIPKLVGKIWEEASKELQQFLERLKNAEGPQAIEGGTLASVLENAGDLITATKSGGSLTPVALEVGPSTGAVLITNLTKLWKLSWETPTSWLARTVGSKGDILTSDGSTAVAKTLGTNGQILRVNTGEATGLAWQTLDALFDEEFEFDSAGELLSNAGGGVVYTLEPGANGKALYSNGSGQALSYKYPGDLIGYTEPASGVAIDVASITTSDESIHMSEWSYVVEVYGTAPDIQYSTGRFLVHGVNVDGAPALSLTVLGLGAAGSTEDAQFCSTGTLTVAISTNVSGDNATVQVTATTSLGSPYIGVSVGFRAGYGSQVAYL